METNNKLKQLTVGFFVESIRCYLKEQGFVLFLKVASCRIVLFDFIDIKSITFNIISGGIYKYILVQC